MRFTLYTDKTVPQCLSALNGRMQAKETASRPALDGWIERGGDFGLQVTQPVFGKFVRTTRLNGHIERQSGVTVITGMVPHGSPPRDRGIALGAVAVLGLLIAAGGQPLLAMLLIPAGLWLHITMTGDYLNGPLLLGEVQRALKAKTAPPKGLKPPAVAPAARPATPARSPARTGSAASKPARSTPKPAPKPTPRSAPARFGLDDDNDDEAPPPVNEDVQPRLM